ncbi:MAG: DUF6317 family protein [Segniliparus sp.]|uniref:DUF6317 family protein n=1 Tax=Segniliparus sp. TaxID=2804064 RepID=UPI003F30B860
MASDSRVEFSELKQLAAKIHAGPSNLVSFLGDLAPAPPGSGCPSLDAQLQRVVELIGEQHAATVAHLTGHASKVQESAEAYEAQEHANARSLTLGREA